MTAWYPCECLSLEDHDTIQDEWGPEEIKEVDDFNDNHTKNHLWHFVDLPLGTKAYPNLDYRDEADPVKAFISDEGGFRGGHPAAVEKSIVAINVRRCSLIM
jgi:hypothetical protein